MEHPRRCPMQVHTQLLLFLHCTYPTPRRSHIKNHPAAQNPPASAAPCRKHVNLGLRQAHAAPGFYWSEKSGVMRRQIALSVALREIDRERTGGDVGFSWAWKRRGEAGCGCGGGRGIYAGSEMCVEGRKGGERERWAKRARRARRTLWESGCVGSSVGAPFGKRV